MNVIGNLSKCRCIKTTSIVGIVLNDSSIWDCEWVLVRNFRTWWIFWFYSSGQRFPVSNFGQSCGFFL